MDRPVIALVLAGGVGTRLYPAARPDRPKQFLSLGGDRSLLERTVARAEFADHVAVVTRERYADGVRERVPEADVLVEPVPKDTGPALVYATHRLGERFENPVVVALPSDHYVGDADAFRTAMGTGARVAARTGALVTFGVEPTRPETGYGYLEPGADRGDHRVLASFHEKPDRETAERYLDAGHLWNAGTFAWTTDALLDAARGSPLAPLVAALDRGDPAAGFERVPAASVDHAIMERAADAVVVPVAYPWDDLGTWDAVGRIGEADGDGNVALGTDPTLVDATDDVVATDGTHVSLVGVEGVAVVAWDDRVLVVPRSDAGRVREVVARLRAEGRFDRREGADGTGGPGDDGTDGDRREDDADRPDDRTA
ncbi:MAG: mannose-1-phosphate guanylyltransferase [Haloferacaceae archaeon]